MKKIFTPRILFFTLFALLLNFDGYSQCFSPGVTMTITTTQPLCYGVSTGSIQITINGGIAPYTFSMFSDTIPDQSINKAISTHTFSNLPPGNYLIAAQVTLPTGFTFCTQNVTISSPPQIVINGNINPPLCNSGSNASIDASVSGGTPPYSYSWSNGSTSEDISGITAGSYTLTVTDANNCNQIRTFTITEPTPITLTPSITNVTCNGAGNGSISITPNGGTAPYTYLWSNGATSQNINGLSGGLYSVTVTDLNGCQQTFNYNVNEPAVISLTASIGDATCPGLSDGTIDLTVSGGTPPFTYSWSNGSTSQDLSGLPSGTYSVTVTDGNGCQQSSPFTVSEPAPLVIIPTITNVSCPGGNNGAISIVVTDGVAPYSYSWSSGSNASGISGLTIGSYSVTVTDANLCTRNASFTITQPPAISIIESITNVSCNGGSNGSISLNISGGTPPYNNFQWNGVASTQNITGLPAGSHTVSFTDANGCPYSATYNISQPSAIGVTPAITNVTCNGAGNGSINLTVNGGTAPYTYAWVSPASNSSSISGLSGGSYTVTVTDNNGCGQTVSFTVNEPAALSLSATIGDATCPGLSDGTIDLTVNGGTPAYTYSWSNGATSQDISGLPSGNYTVTVTDGNGCQQSSTFTVSEPAPLVITPTITNVSCPGGSNGSISVVVSAGVPSYSYSWSTGSTASSISGLSSGTYTIVVTDANLCTRNASFTVNEPAPITIGGSPVNATCLGINNGSIDITVNGGTPGYTYLWSNGATSQDISGLSGGSYSVTVTDLNGCQQSRTFNVNQPPAMNLSANVTNVNCSGNNNGSIDLTVTGGSAPYTYSWNTTPVSNSQDLSGLSGGNYTVLVTDNNGCSQSATYTINVPSPLTLSTIPVHVTCNGGTNGSIDLIVNGGTSPFTYSWSNGAGSEDISGLGAGNYSVTVTDANGCQQNTSVTINQPPAININGSATDVLCNGGNNGSIDITITNGVAPLNILWSNGATSEDISGLTAGNYSVTVSDANGCSQTANFTINEPSALSLTANTTDIPCNSGNTGSIDLSVSGGTLPYTYSWSNGANSQDISGLVAGSYSVIVTDGSGCQQNGNFSISEPTPISISPSVIHLICNGGSNGSIDIAVSGGVAPYNFVWSNGASTEDISSLTAGTYNVSVTDNSGCNSSLNITVNEPLPITISDNTINATCTGLNDGSIDITVTGGTAPYNYSWSNGSTSQDISSLAGGTYSVTVTDANGCTQNASFNISQPSAITLNGIENHLNCFGAGNGSIDLTITGGAIPFNISWSNGLTTEDLSGLSGGNYTVNVTDANGCTQSASFNINEPAGMTLSANISNAYCGGANDGAIDLEVSGGTAPYTYAWSNGANTQDLTSVSNGTYSVTVTDANTCSQTANYNVTVTLRFDMTIVVSPPSCNGNSNGEIIVVQVNNGTAPYTYSFEGSAFSSNMIYNNLSAGSYTLTVRDNAGCTQDSVIIVTQPDVLDLIASFNSPICSYGNNGQVTLSTTGGTPVFQFSDNGVAYSNQNIFGNLNPGTYRYFVRDGNGCIDSIDATLAAHPQVNMAALTVNLTHLTCNGVNIGRIDVSNITGATRPLLFSLNGGIPQTDSSFRFLSAGNHVLQIIDAFGCINPYNFTINTPPAIDFNLVLVQEETCTNMDGVLRLYNVSGGVSPYTYRFNGGAPVNYTGQVDFTNLGSNTYSVTVTDATTPTCSNTKSIDLPKKPGPIPYVKLNMVNCPGGSDGIIDIDSLQGGVPLFNITLADTLGYTNTIMGVGRYQHVTFSGLAPHLYGMTIQDQECTYQTNAFYIWNTDSLKYFLVLTDSLLITQPAPITSKVVTFNADRYKPTGSAMIYNFTGGTPGYWYMYGNGTNTQVMNDTFYIQNLKVGNYTAYFTDSKGCPHVFDFTIGVDLYIPNLITPNGDNSNDVFEIVALPAGSELRIFNRWGSRVYFSNNYDNLWNGSNEPDGVYYFELLLPNNRLYKGWVEIIR